MTRLSVRVPAALLGLLLIASAAWAIDPAPPLEDAALQARYKGLVHELRCLKCQGETIADTSAMFASDLRRQVREALLAGQSDEQIRQYMVDRYGAIILLRPAWSPQNAWLWLAPGVFLIGGAFVAWRVVRQRRVLLETDDTPVPDEETLPNP